MDIQYIYNMYNNKKKYQNTKARHYLQSLKDGQNNVKSLPIKQIIQLDHGAVLSRKRSQKSQLHEVSKWKINKTYIQSYNSEQKGSKSKQHLLIKIPNISLVELKDKLVVQSNEQKRKVYLTEENDSKDSGQQCKSRQRYGQYDGQQKEQKRLMFDRAKANRQIQKSNHFISLIRKNNKKLIKIKFRNVSQKFSLPKIQSNDDSFSYLKRDKLRLIKGEIDQKLIKNYISHSCQKDQIKIEQRARKFLMQKVKNDYFNHAQVQGHKMSIMSDKMHQQLLKKKLDFDSELIDRKHSAFLCFLSLSNKQKANILQRKSLKANKTQAF